MKRDVLADQLKGYACLLVLFGHVLIGIRTAENLTTPAFARITEEFIWTFHIDLFMFLSGYVYSITGGAAAGGSRTRFIAKKFLNLGIPYLLFSVVYICVNALTPGVNNAGSLRDLLYLPIRPVAQYWFLFALFWLFVLWALLSRFLKNYMITAGLFTIFLICKYFGVDLGILDSSMNCVLAFGIGTSIHSLRIQKVPTWVRFGILPFHVALVTFLLLKNYCQILLVDDFATLLGIFASICFIDFAVRSKIIARFLLWVCKYSFPIYLLHTFFTAATRIFLIKLGITDYWIHVAAGTVIGLALPVLAAKITEKVPLLGFCFYPSRTLKSLRGERNGGKI